MVIKLIKLILGAPPFLGLTIGHKTHHEPSDRANTFFYLYAFTAYSKKVITFFDLYTFTAHFYGPFERANTTFDLYVSQFISERRRAFSSRKAF